MKKILNKIKEYLSVIVMLPGIAICLFGSVFIELGSYIGGYNCTTWVTVSPIDDEDESKPDEIV